MKKTFYLIFLAFLISCSSKDMNSNAVVAEEETVEKGSIAFTTEQIDLAEIITARIEKKEIAETIECSGTIEVPPENIATVSPIIGGFIKTLNYYPGDVVEKGATLAYLQHSDFINLQQQYIEAKSQADYYKEEYKRQGELTVENAASIKKMQKAKADYLSTEATYKSLKSQLELLGVNTENIEKGDFVKEFKLVAPIKGSISQLNANTGTYASSENFVYEIINSNILNVNMNIFEKDISKVKVGQKVQFNILNNDKQFVSKVKRAGIKIDKSNRTTLVQGIIDNKNQYLKPGMYVSAFISINEKEAFVIPIEAIVDQNGESFIFLKKDLSFKKIKIEKGFEYGCFFEIRNPDKELLSSEIVIKGTYYLMAKTEGEE
ncbi:MAG: efflux RND transporter periplasmic adaptor subunit [Bacteroidales bacterium]|nr:efflux RND transporter periplasmic adaptor subunit [Bacteroidales bacterium]